MGIFDVSSRYKIEVLEQIELIPVKEVNKQRVFQEIKQVPGPTSTVFLVK